MLNPEELEATRRVALQKLGPWANRNPNQQILCQVGSGQQVLTRRQILDAVQQGTSIGQRLLERWHRLALGSILDAEFSEHE